MQRANAFGLALATVIVEVLASMSSVTWNDMVQAFWPVLLVLGVGGAGTVAGGWIEVSRGEVTVKIQAFTVLMTLGVLDRIHVVVYACEHRAARPGVPATPECVPRYVGRTTRQADAPPLRPRYR